MRMQSGPRTRTIRDNDDMDGPEQEGSEEARAVTPAHDPGECSKADCEHRILTHVPYPAWWWAWCATGRGRSAHHRRTRSKGEGGFRKFAMGLCFITAASILVLCAKCSQAGVVAAHVVTRKEATPALVR